MPKRAAEVYQLKVTLRGVRPPIWRRLLVRGDTTLRKLHDVLQVAMRWENYHMHAFRVAVRTFDPEAFDADEANARLRRFR